MPVSPYYLVVRVARGLLALPVAQVVETCRMVPGMETSRDGAMLGMATLRGVPTAVFDLASLLGGERDSVGNAATERLVVMKMPAGAAALRVEEVVGVQTLDPGSLQAIALPGGEERSVGRFDREFARLMDGVGLLLAAGTPEESLS